MKSDYGKKTLNVLVISKSPWSETNALGNTYSNFFGKWDNVNFMNLYLREELPQNDICSDYYNISEKQIVRNIFNPRNIGRNFSKDYLIELENKNCYMKEVYQEKKMLDFFRSHNQAIFHIAREFVWKLGRWKNNELYQFLKKGEIDIIVAAASGPIYFQEVVNYCMDVTDAKLILFFSDDTYCYKNKMFLDYMYQFSLRKLINKSVKRAVRLYGASQMLCDEYKMYFNKDIEPLYKGCYFDEQIVSIKTTQIIKIVYAGNLYYGRWKTLKVLADEIVRANCQTTKLSLEIYTTTTITSEIDKALNRGQSSKIMGGLSYQEVKKVLADADIVLHVESFEQEHIKTTRLSFSTKIIDCMQSGSGIMAIGPSNVASIKYLEDIEGAIVITNLTDIREVINDTIENPGRIVSNAILLRKYAMENHDISKVRNKLQRDFRQIAKSDDYKLISNQEY